MGVDSLIRLRQINQTELSGFCSGIFSIFSIPAPTGSLIPSNSGISSLGSNSFPYGQIFANQLTLASGSGINFGNTSFNAYLSGGFAVVDVGGILITSNDEFVYIQGPSGATGVAGPSGLIGLSGIGVTGASYNTSTNILTFSFSNNSTSSFNFQGLSGATGVSVTGFFQSGNLIYPQFSHFQGRGSPLTLIAGPPGPPGSILLNFQQDGSNSFYPVTNFPTGVVINPYYYNTPAPPISLMRGMSYSINASGLDSHTITSEDLIFLSQSGLFSGQSLPFVVGTQVNYFENSASTGYWRLVFFPSGTNTGFYTTASNPSLFVETSNTQVYGNSLSNDIFRTGISFVANFTAQNQYEYGFMVYTLGGLDTTTDVILTSPTGYAYVLGPVYFSSGIGPVGPQGPSGLSGLQGIPGSGGDVGPSGEQGRGILSYNQQQVGPLFQLQFVFDDNTVGPWINLPSGGPAGPQGPVGSLNNYFSGNYSNILNYGTNTVVVLSGSSYINTGGYTSGNPPPAAPWQTLASGMIGPSGATGTIGPSGAPGSLSNHFSGNFVISSSYSTDTVITFNGSSYVNTGSSNASGVFPPTAPWQLIASIGSQGPAGANQALRCTANSFVTLNYNGFGNNSLVLFPSGLNVTGGSGIDIFNILITGNGTQLIGGYNGVFLDFDWNHFQTGQSILLKVRNSGVLNANGGSPPLFNFSGLSNLIKWPNQIYTRPENGQEYIYTILRWPDSINGFAAYGTYSNPYVF